MGMGSGYNPYRDFERGDIRFGTVSGAQRPVRLVFKREMPGGKHLGAPRLEWWDVEEIVTGIRRQLNPDCIGFRKLTEMEVLAWAAENG